jgi:hypothetical protein
MENDIVRLSFITEDAFFFKERLWIFSIWSGIMRAGTCVAADNWSRNWQLLAGLYCGKYGKCVSRESDTIAYRNADSVWRANSQNKFPVCLLE